MHVPWDSIENGGFYLQRRFKTMIRSIQMTTKTSSSKRQRLSERPILVKGGLWMVRGFSLTQMIFPIFESPIFESHKDDNPLNPNAKYFHVIFIIFKYFRHRRIRDRHELNVCQILKLKYHYPLNITMLAL